MVANNFYAGETYIKKNPGWHVDASTWKAGNILRMLQRNNLTPTTICEIGCGAGEILRILQQHLPPEATFDGYEISPLAYSLAQQRANDRLHFHLADYFQAQHPPVDLILIIDVLEHFENCFQILRDLKPQSAYKIFLIPLDISVVSVALNALIDYRHATGHLHFFTKDVILEVLHDAGYELLDTFYTLPPLDPTPWSDIRKQPHKVARKGIRLAKRGLQRLPGRILYPINKDLAVRLFGGWKLVVLAR